MSKNKERYIVYLNMEYFERMCQRAGIQTEEERDELYHKIYDQINNFLTGHGAVGILATDIFTASNGELQKAIEIYRLSNMARINTLADLKCLMDKQRKRGYVE